MTKNKFVHTSEKMSIFPENMRKPKEKTTFLKKYVDFFVHFWSFFGRVLSGHFFPAVFFWPFYNVFLDFFFLAGFFGPFFFGRFLGRPEADLKGGSGGAVAPPAKVALGFVV